MRSIQKNKIILAVYSDDSNKISKESSSVSSYISEDMSSLDSDTK
jgi:hypothetical protein